MTDELKPVNCGCGGEAMIRKHTFYRAMPLYQVRCPECGIATSTRNTEAEAITAWNRAMGADKIDELIEHIWREKLDTREAIVELVERMLK